MASFGIIGTTRRETTRSVTGLHKKTDEAFVDLDVVVVVVVVLRGEGIDLRLLTPPLLLYSSCSIVCPMFCSPRFLQRRQSL